MFMLNMLYKFILDNRWISDLNKLHIALLFYSIKIAKLYEISKLVRFLFRSKINLIIQSYRYPKARLIAYLNFIKIVVHLLCVEKKKFP